MSTSSIPIRKQTMEIAIHYEAGVIEDSTSEVLAYHARRDLSALLHTYLSQDQTRVTRLVHGSNVVRIDLDLAHDNAARVQLKRLLGSPEDDEFSKEMDKRNIHRIFAPEDTLSTLGSETNPCRNKASPSKTYTRLRTHRLSVPAATSPSSTTSPSPSLLHEGYELKPAVFDTPASVTPASGRKRRKLDDAEMSECPPLEITLDEMCNDSDIFSTEQPRVREPDRDVLEQTKVLLRDVLIKANEAEAERLRVEEKLRERIAILETEVQRERKADRAKVELASKCRAEAEQMSNERISKLECDLKDERELRRQTKLELEQAEDLMQRAEQARVEERDQDQQQKETLAAHERSVRERLEREVDAGQQAATVLKNELSQLKNQLAAVQDDLRAAKEKSQACDVELAQEREKRREADRLVEDHKAECRYPFVVPALFEIFHDGIKAATASVPSP